MPSASVDPYNFDPNFMRVVLRHAVLSSRFWDRIGPSLEPEAFPEGAERLIARAAAAIGKESGRVAGSTTILIARLMRWREMGEVTKEEVIAVDDLLEELEFMDSPPDPDDVVRELVPTIRERRNREGMRMGLKAVASRDEMAMDEVISHLQATQRLGEAVKVTGTRLGPEALDVIRHVRKTERLPTGIVELDTELNGGPLAGTLSIWMGGSGDGKSMALAHMAGSSLLGMHNVAVVTLELSEELWLTRLMANITGIPVDAIYDGSMEKQCEQRLEQIPRGACVVGQFVPDVTKVSDIMSWVEETERRDGVEFDVLVVDYADLMGHSKARDYEGMREVYAGLRDKFSVKRNAWTWSASQARRRNKQGEKQGADDAADSQHKIRVSDLWINLRTNEDASEIEYFVAKNRGGKRGGSVTLPTELECARIAPIADFGGTVGEDPFSDLF